MDKELNHTLNALKNNVEHISDNMAGLRTVVYTEKDVIAMLGISKQILYKWRKKGIITFSKMGKQVFFSDADIKNFLDKTRQ